MGVSRPTLINWLSQEKYDDSRGWKKDKGRKYTDDQVVQRIVTLRKQRIEDKKYFIGSDHVQKDYARKYPKEILPSQWFIEETIRDKELQAREVKKKKVKGGSEYLLYPTQSIKGLGYLHQSADFIGKKYISGRSEPINIFSTCYYSPVKLYQIERVLAEKAVYVIDSLEKTWQVYPIPNVFRIDNGLTFRGTAAHKRVLGKFLIFLLNLNMIPLFGSPSKPWNNPYVEGHNRVFNEKVWRKNHFTSFKQINEECKRFNKESEELFKFRYADLIVNNPLLFRYLEKDETIDYAKLKTVENKKICFIRFAESPEEKQDAQFIIMNDIVYLPQQYSHQFVFAEWLLDKEQLLIYSEYQKKRTLIKTQKFEINS